jgi:hypothetical protein
MNAVNYHVHFIFLLPLLAAGRGLLAFGAPLLAFCVAGYWIDLEPDFGRRFEALTVLLFATLGWLYANALPAQPIAAPRPAADSAPDPATHLEG